MVNSQNFCSCRFPPQDEVDKLLYPMALNGPTSTFYNRHVAQKHIPSSQTSVLRFLCALMTMMVMPWWIISDNITMDLVKLTNVTMNPMNNYTLFITKVRWYSHGLNLFHNS